MLNQHGAEEAHKTRLSLLRREQANGAQHRRRVNALADDRARKSQEGRNRFEERRRNVEKRLQDDQLHKVEESRRKNLSLQEKLRHASVVKQLTSSQLRNCRERFQTHDQEKAGKISKTALRSILEELGVIFSHNQFDSFLAALGGAQNGLDWISFLEVIVYIHRGGAGINNRGFLSQINPHIVGAKLRRENTAIKDSFQRELVRQSLNEDDKITRKQFIESQTKVMVQQYNLRKEGTSRGRRTSLETCENLSSRSRSPALTGTPPNMKFQRPGGIKCITVLDSRTGRPLAASLRRVGGRIAPRRPRKAKPGRPASGRASSFMKGRGYHISSRNRVHDSRHFTFALTQGTNRPGATSARMVGRRKAAVTTQRQ